MLDRLAIAKAQDMDVVVRDRATSRRDAHEVPGLATVVRGPKDDQVVFADDLMYLPSLVGEHLREPEHRPGDALEPGRLVPPPAVRHDIRVGHLGQPDDVARREDVLERPTCDLLQVVRHGSALRSLGSPGWQSLFDASIILTK